MTEKHSINKYDQKIALGFFGLALSMLIANYTSDVFTHKTVFLLYYPKMFLLALIIGVASAGLMFTASDKHLNSDMKRFFR